MAKYYFFREDLSVLQETINELQRKIKELGIEQGRVARQSTEIFGHDDACQEAVYQERRVVISRLNNLGSIVSNALIVEPQRSYDSICMGAAVELDDGRVFRIGSFIVAADHQIQNISYSSPLAQVLMSKQESEEVEFLGKTLTIKRVK